MFKETIEIWKHILSMNNFKIVILGQLDGQLDGHLNLPICIQRECVHSKCLQNNHLAT